jgi:hypothetical protein
MDNERPSEGIFILPGGLLLAENRCLSEAELRPLTGYEEDWLAHHPGTPSALAVTRLLSTCLVRLDDVPPSRTLAQHLLVGDRDYLMLQLRRITLGAAVSAVLACPACDAKMDVDFNIADVPITRHPQTALTYTLEFNPEEAPMPVPVSAGDEHALPAGPSGPSRSQGSEGLCSQAEPLAGLSAPAMTIGPCPGPLGPGFSQEGPGRIVRFRLPTGLDQEAVLDLPAAEAADALLARCLVDNGGIPLSPDEQAAVSAAMEQLAPAVDLELDLICPECGHTFLTPFDTTAFFLSEMCINGAQLLKEVHLLALHYHWSEGDILGLTRARRRAYLHLLSDALRT